MISKDHLKNLNTKKYVKKDYLILYLKGFMIGIADLIPGISGGTVAFLLGIYSEFLESITNINKDFLLSLIKLDFKSALTKINFKFIFPILIGILSAMISLARLIHYLLNNHTVLIWSFFFGLILASIIILIKELKDISLSSILLFSSGTTFSYFLVTLIPIATPETPLYILLCGIIAITAMILPGISGSFLLLILGKYEYITSALKNPFTANSFSILAIFYTGAFIGLLIFSKLLNYLLKNYYHHSMTFLVGVIVGSIKKVWPWKEVLETKIVRGKIKVLSDTNILPQDLSNQTIFAFLLIILGILIVLLLNRSSLSRK